MEYDFLKIEKKWQKYWEKTGLYKVKDPPEGKKFYLLEMYAYPSGDLHMGHFRNYVIGDVESRFRLMQGYSCLHPFGWDSFGLPAEGAAIEKGISPYEWTMNNIKKAKQTIKRMGISYDWDREVITSNPEYYKWTQWLFLKLWENGLAYKKEAFVNWCPYHQTTLANEQVDSLGRCWRCGKKVVKKELTQWFIKITNYAERLLKNLEKLEKWPERVKELQRRWIGRSEGVEIYFKYKGKNLPVFTTRPDTIYGVTFIVTSHLSPLAKEIGKKNKEVKKYIEEGLFKSEGELRVSKEGKFTGEYALHPLTGEKLPIWIAYYILPTYGTGVVMGVPAHDERDFIFAKENNLAIKKVIIPPDGKVDDSCAYTGEGILINSDKFNKMFSPEGRKKITSYLLSRGLAKTKVNYHIKDWLISRQRYWGAPIPIVYCSKCEIVGVPIEDLPVLLPKKVEFMVSGKSPLATNLEFLNTTCPKCGRKAKRDTDTMDTFVDSSWYWIRYLDPHNEKEPWDVEKVKNWLPIDKYIGGIEHATGHLIYFRFISLFLYDLGLLPYEEPCVELLTHGMIVDKEGKVMSKSKGNAIPVGPFINQHGADVGRLTMLFIGPASQDVKWQEEGVKGMKRFVRRVCELVERYDWKDIPLEKGSSLHRKLNTTIKKVTEGITNHTHNTSIAGLMEFTNELYKMNQKEAPFVLVQTLLQLLAPFAPHLAEELWQEKLKIKGDSIFKTQWPKEEEIEEKEVTIIVEVDGKVRGKLVLPTELKEEEVREEAFKLEKVKKRVKNLKEVIYVKNKVINFVTK